MVEYEVAFPRISPENCRSEILIRPPFLETTDSSKIREKGILPFLLFESVLPLMLSPPLFQSGSGDLDCGLFGSEMSLVERCCFSYDLLVLGDSELLLLILIRMVAGEYVSYVFIIFSIFAGLIQKDKRKGMN